MHSPRSIPAAAALAALLLVGGALAGCDEDSVYEDNGPVQNQNAPTTSVTPNPGLADAGTASPIPTRTDDVGIGGEERSGGDPAD